MQTPDANARAKFYFSFPRLFVRLRGGDAGRSQANWFEANAVGTAMHLIAYLFAASILLAPRPLWAQVLFSIPLAFLVLLFWMVVLYFNTVLVRWLRRAGLFRDLPVDRAQGVLVGGMITAMACQLASTEHWARILGLFWIAAVTCNLIAAGLLGITQASRAASR